MNAKVEHIEEGVEKLVEEAVIEEAANVWKAGKRSLAGSQSTAPK